jgi:hypothetical protein
MLCPNCGTQTSAEQKFCRNCGMNLEPVSKALAAHLAQGGLESPPAAEVEGERRDLRRMTNGLILGVAVILLGALILTDARLFMLRPWLKLLGTFVTCLGVFLSLLAVLSPLRSAGRRRAATPPGQLESAKTTGPLLDEAAFEPMPSVTERTTDLLGVVNRTKPRRE